MRCAKFGDAKISDLGALNAVFFLRGQQDVGGLDIAMNDAVLVCVRERFRDLLSNLANAFKRKSLSIF